MPLWTMSLLSPLQSYCLAEYADHSRQWGNEAHFLRIGCGIISERMVVTKDPLASTAVHK